VVARKKSSRKPKKASPDMPINHNGQFGIYETFLSSVIRKQKIKGYPSKLVLERTIHALARDAENSGQPLFKFVESGIFQKMVCEYSANKGVPVIFPESKVLLESLSDSTFKFNKKVSVPMPFDTFSVALPRGIEVEGVKLKGILISKGNSSDLIQEPRIDLVSMIYNTNASTIASVYADPDSVADFRILKDEAGNETSKEQFFTISVQFNDPKSKVDVSALTSTFSEEYLSLALKSKTPEQMLSLAEMYTDEDKMEGLDDIKLVMSHKSNAIIMHAALRIVASTAVYLSLEGTKLRKGLPSSFSGEMPNLNNFSPNSSAYFIPNSHKPEMGMEESMQKGASYRKFHFRNLQHEKYYQGEHRDKERGSRWVPVSPSLVNSIDDPYTLTP
jgi:hypothetical protein